MLNSLDQSIKNRFGSKKGLLRAGHFQARLLLGAFRRYRHIDLSKIERLVFICSGNICRSPLAEIVAKDAGIDSVSYGLHTRGGDKADPRAIAFAESIGLSLEEHVTQNIKDYQAKPGDLLVGMEPKHNREMEQLFGLETPMTLAGLWLESPRPYIHDPHNTNPKFFESCERQVTDATRGLAKRLNR